MTLKSNWLGSTRASREMGGVSRMTFSKWLWLVPAMAAGIAVPGIAPCGCKQGTPPAKTAIERTAPGPLAATEAPAQDTVGKQTTLPRLVDLGATKCIPCKMMAPILEDLKKTYAAKMDVQFIDVWENPDAGKKYGINAIPTQIFYDAGGKELFRHEGFYSKEEILAKWKELGVDLAPE